MVVAGSTDLKCGKCGSAQVVPRARVIDRGDYSADSGNIGVAVARRPHALIFKNSELADVYARVCGACGFVELFIDEPAEIYAAHEESRLTPE